MCWTWCLFMFGEFSTFCMRVARRAGSRALVTRRERHECSTRIVMICMTRGRFASSQESLRRGGPSGNPPRPRPGNLRQRRDHSKRHSVSRQPTTIQHSSTRPSATSSHFRTGSEAVLETQLNEKRPASLRLAGALGEARKRNPPPRRPPRTRSGTTSTTTLTTTTPPGQRRTI